MIPETKKILYTTDLSPNSSYAFRYAVANARRHGAKIVILHVMEPLSVTADAVVSIYLSDNTKKDLEESKKASLFEIIRRRLNLLCEKEGDADPHILDRIESIDIAEGYPGDVILKKAEALNCDIVVMGTHGKGALKTAVLGSVSHQVLRHAHKPIYVIPLPVDEANIAAHDVDAYK